MSQIDPIAARAFSIEVVRKLRQANFEAYWAGGCVRDQILNRQPKDYDVATSATPAQIRELFGNKRTLAIGAAFGVISILGPKAAGPIEVATFRSDGEYTDGRHPDSVQFTTAEQDAQRRDFTINGMFIDPLEDRIIDFVGGRQDVEAKLIRAIQDPHQRIEEDKLRMLRAVRFAATLNFDLERATLDAVRQHAAQINMVSAERIAAELRRMFAHDNRCLALQLLHESGLLAFVLPGLAMLSASSQWWTDTQRILAGMAQPTFPKTMAAIYRHRYQGPQCEIVAELGDALKLSRVECETISHLLANEEAIRNASDATWPAVQRILVQDHVEDLLDCANAISIHTGRGADGVSFCREKIALPESQWNPLPLVDGGDLHRLGVHAGPIFREILEAVRDRQLNGQLSNKESAIEWLRSRFQV